MSRRSAGFSMVEVMMALAIVVVLTSLTITQYDSMSASAREQSARSELDTLRNEIVQSQLERRMDWSMLVPPRDKNGRERHDPWGQPYRIDPAGRVVYSLGPDGQDQRGQGDDVSLRYDRYQALELKPPTGVRVAEHGNDWALVAWNEVSFHGGVLGYNVFRRDSASASDFTTTPQNEAPVAEKTEFRDEGLQPGHVYYYSVEVVAKDGTRMRSPGVMGFTIPNEAPPRISVSPATVVAATSQTVSFTLVATGFGAALTQVRFDNETFPVGAGEKTLVLTRKWTAPGNYTLNADASDERGRTSNVSVHVQVKDTTGGR